MGPVSSSGETTTDILSFLCVFFPFFLSGHLSIMSVAYGVAYTPKDFEKTGKRNVQDVVQSLQSLKGAGVVRYVRVH